MSAFTKPIKEAKERNEFALAKRISHEQAICKAIVKYALANDMMVSIYDGEEWCLKFSNSQADIMNALFSTDGDTIMLRTATGEQVGKFFLVYGNDGYDVVSDYTITETTETIYETVIKPLADKLEAQG